MIYSTIQGYKYKYKQLCSPLGPIVGVFMQLTWEHFVVSHPVMMSDIVAHNLFVFLLSETEVVRNKASMETGCQQEYPSNGVNGLLAFVLHLPGVQRENRPVYKAVWLACLPHVVPSLPPHPFLPRITNYYWDISPVFSKL